MDLNSFIIKYHQRYTEPPVDKFSKQCVRLYRKYCEEVLAIPQSPGVIGAYQLYDTYLPQYFDKLDWKEDLIIPEGSIVIWGKSVGDGFGHVAIFLSGNSNQFVSLDQNWPVGSVVHLQPHDSNGILGFLIPKSLQMPINSGSINVMEPFEVTVINKPLNVRTSPHVKDSKIVKTLPVGTKIEVVEGVNGDDPGSGNPLWFKLKERRLSFLDITSNDLFIWSGGTDTLKLPELIDWQERAEVDEEKLMNIAEILED